MSDWFFVAPGQIEIKSVCCLCFNGDLSLSMFLGSAQMIALPIWRLSAFCDDVPAACTRTTYITTRMRIVNGTVGLFIPQFFHIIDLIAGRICTAMNAGRSKRTQILLYMNISSRWPLHSLYSQQFSSEPVLAIRCQCALFSGITILTLSTRFHGLYVGVTLDERRVLLALSLLNQQ